MIVLPYRRLQDQIVHTPFPRVRVIEVNLLCAHAQRREIVTPRRLHFECVRVGSYVARYEPNSGLGGFAKSGRVRGETVELHDSGEWNDNRPAQASNK